MKSLIERANMSAPTDERVKELVKIIDDTNLDYIMSEKLEPTTGDDEINEAIDRVTNAFYLLTRVLKSKGYINVNGYKITSKNNI